MSTTTCPRCRHLATVETFELTDRDGTRPCRLVRCNHLGTGSLVMTTTQGRDGIETRVACRKAEPEKAEAKATKSKRPSRTDRALSLHRPLKQRNRSES